MYPFFIAQANNSPNFAFDSAAGCYLVLAFVEDADHQRSFINALAKSSLFNNDFASLFFVTPNPKQQLPYRVPGVRAFFDTNHGIKALYGVSTLPTVFIISPRLQLLGVFSKAKESLRFLAALPPIQQRPEAGQAPIVIIPNIFEPAFCQQLIQVHKQQGGRKSGFMRDINGKTVEIDDPRHKIRYDCIIREQNLLRTIQQCILRRAVPEIHKAFQFSVTRMERYLVACYTAEDGGHFSPHRDNTTYGTAHRRFAMSLNLNAEEYEGGDLCFPEYGMQTYRPPTGGALVFSCSMLHQATRVTKGERYVFLPFLYDEAAAAVREENLSRVAQK